MKRLVLVMSIVGVLCGTVLDARALSVSEPPDVSGSIGTLSAGLNTVTGSVSPGDDVDAFVVSLPAGLTITSGQVIVTEYFKCFPFCTSAGGQGVDGQLSSSALNIDATISGNQTLPVGGLPFATSGNVDFQLLAPFGLNGPNEFVTGRFDYALQLTVSATVTAVPEPSILLVLASGVLTLGLLRRRPLP